jgi:hypothetical protein
MTATSTYPHSGTLIPGDADRGSMAAIFLAYDPRYATLGIQGAAI